MPPPGGTLVYTDGACWPNPGPGGWAWVRSDGTGSANGFDPSTTNQRMELMAALMAIGANHEKDLVIVSDSAYLVNCFRDQWWKKWMRKDWRGVKNTDIWQPLINVANERRIRFSWVKGHSGDRWNDEADRLAEMAVRGY